MKKKILILFLMLGLFITAYSNEDIKKEFIIYDNLNISTSIGSYSSELKISFPYYTREINLNNLIKIFDHLGNEVPIQPYYRNKYVYIRKDNFKKDLKYILQVKGDILNSKRSKISYDFKTDFVFNYKELSINRIHTNIKFNNLESAHFILSFYDGRIITKDIRDYLSFSTDVNYSYTIKGQKLYVYGDFKPNTTYEVFLKKGFKTYSSIAKEDIKLKVSFKDMNSNIKFKDYKSYVSSYTEAIEIETTNIEALNVEIIKIHSENLNFINLFQNYILRNNSYYNILNYGESVDKFKKIIPFEKNKTINTQLNFNDKLKHKEDGIYVINIQNSEGSGKDSKIVFKSDLGISVKIAKDQMFFSVRSLATNKSIKDAEILVYSNSNKLIFKDVTNNHGILDKKYKNIIDSNPKLVIVKKDKNINFLNLVSPISSYDILNNRLNIQSEYDSLVFMERTLLRPSDSINMLISVKNKEFKSLKNQTVYLEFLDPSLKKLFTEKLELNDAGIAEYKFTSYNNYKTGKYRVNVLLGKTKIGYKEFYIEAFIPEKIEVNINSKKDKFLLDEKIDFELSSQYLFGTPAKSLKYNMEVITNDSNFISNSFSSYTFSNALNKTYNPKTNISNFKENGFLDDNGNKNFNIKLKVKDATSSMLIADLIGTVFDDGRAVRKYKRVDVFPFNSIVGLRKEVKNSYFQVNEKLKINTILINPINDTKMDKVQRLKVKVLKLYYHYYAGEEIREIENFFINSNEDIIITPKESGEYYVVVETNDGQISSEHFYVSGWDYNPLNIKNKSSYIISLKTNKDIYNHGEIINLDVKSPIAGKLLLTFEEDEILDYGIYELESNTSNIDIKVPKNMKKGAYIKAQLIRKTSSNDDIFPFRVIGSTYIKKDNKEKKVNVDIISEKLYKSDDEVKIKISSDSKSNAYAVISMVDIGILNIINEKPTNAFKYFDRKIQDNISLYDLYSNLKSITKLKFESTSGGGDLLESSSSKNLFRKEEKFISPDAINERVKPISYWSKIIKLDDNGEGMSSFKLPSFNGELLIQALVVNSDQIGSNFEKITIKDDIIIKPTLPRFLVKGDNAIFPIRLLNTTNEIQNIDLFLQSSSNLLLENSKKTLTINPKDSVLVEVSVKALEEGLSKLLLEVSNSKDTFTNKTSIYIKDKYDYKVVSKYGLVNSKETIDVKIIDKDTKLLNTAVNAYVAIDNTPFGKLSKSTKYLIGYPHGCIEQTSSKLLAMLMSKQFIEKTDTELLEKRDLFIKQGIYKLISMQRDDGTFTYWENGNYVNMYASFYTTYVLNLLQENGYEIPSNVIDKALKTHIDKLNQNPQVLDLFITFATKNEINRIYDNKLYGNTLTSYIALAVAMKRDNNISEYETLIKEAKEYFKLYNMNRQREYSYSFYSPIKDIAGALYLYTTFINNDKNDEFRNNLYRLIDSYIKEDKLYSTQDKAFTMLAFLSYFKDIDFDNKNINIILKYEKELESIKSKSYKNIKLKDNENLTITNNGGVVNYTIDINKPVDLPVTSNTSKYDNILIKTGIIDEEGKEIDYNNIDIGSKLFMKVEVASKTRIENVAVNIQIPSGIEIINPRLYKSNNIKFRNINYNPDYEDYRDDRVLSYLTTKSKTTILYIPLIATTKGKFVFPSSYIEAMYDSRLNSYSKPVKQIIIK